MRIEKLKEGTPVVYIPNHLLGEKNIKDENLGIITSVNETYAFVRYKRTNCSQATLPDNLYLLDNRPDLIERLGLEVKPINKICELYLAEKENWKNI